MGAPLPEGPRITAYLRYQIDVAWSQDAARQKVWSTVHAESDLLKLQAQLRQKLLEMIGGLPTEHTDLRPVVTGKISMTGFTIEKVIYQSLPGVYVTSLLYVPNDHARKHPAVLVPAGHSPAGKAYYQALCQRLAASGYVVIAWDPVGQGERSQFWDAKAGKSRYNLVCAEHAVLGNLAYLAGANLARWETWDGIRAVDYLLTRPEVDAERISITGTSGGGFQTAMIAALEPRIKVIVPSCYITALPMRVANRIFVDPDSDPEQDPFGMISNGVDHPGLLLLMYPRPVMIAAAVLDFFPIEGTRKSFREIRGLYEEFGHGDRIAMVEGYHTHQYSVENQEAALRFLNHFSGLPSPGGLPEIKPLNEKDLQCTRTGQVMLDFPDAKPLTEVIRQYFDRRKSSRRESLGAAYLGAGYEDVKGWAVSEYSGATPGHSTIAWEFRGTSTWQGTVIDRFVLHHHRELQMPLLFIHRPSSKARKTLLWFSEQGKAAEADWPEIQKHVDAGYDVISFDFRGLGEMRMRYKAASPDDPRLVAANWEQAYSNPLSSVLGGYVYNSILTGRPYFFQMMDDAAIARRFAEERLHAKVVGVAAPGTAYSVASAIAEVHPGISLVSEPGSKLVRWSELVDQKQELWPIELLLPSGAYIH